MTNTTLTELNLGCDDNNIINKCNLERNEKKKNENEQLTRLEQKEPQRLVNH